MIDAIKIEPRSDWSKILKEQHDMESSKELMLPNSIPVSLSTASILDIFTCVVCLDSIPKEPFELQCGHIGILCHNDSLHPSINQSIIHSFQSITEWTMTLEIGCSDEIKKMVGNNLRCKCGLHAISSRPSTMATQAIAGIEVKCINHENGCTERMTLGKEFSTLAKQSM
jgi:hypothetical protein